MTATLTSPPSTGASPPTTLAPNSSASTRRSYRDGLLGCDMDGRSIHVPRTRPRGQLLARHRTTDLVALRQVAPQLRQHAQRRRVLYPFGHHFQTQPVPQL